MIYSFDITTPANTPANTPKRTELQVTKGLVYQVEVEFPPGPLGYCYVSLWDGGHQVWPSNPDFAFHGDNGWITFPETYLKLAEPYEFTAVTWNIDDTYPHTVHIRLGMASGEVAISRYLPSLSFDKLVETLSSIQTRQEEMREEEKQRVLANPLPWKE